MWEFYLAAVELEFLHGSHMVFQLLLSTRRDAVPITRDFMVDAERAAWAMRSEERRVGKEWRSRRSPHHFKKEENALETSSGSRITAPCFAVPVISLQAR